MEDGVVWPAGVLLAGVAVWIAPVVWHAFVGGSKEKPSWVEPALCLERLSNGRHAGKVVLLTEMEATGAEDPSWT